tara:strand:- start:5850 stop:6242 length:393 start_codon:yes stop_codon:yes gene_type:complete
MAVNLIEFMPFADVLGLEITHSDKDRVSATLSVRKELCTTGKIMHGGAIMSVADTLGAIGAYLNLPEGAKATTTIESKTNFLGAASVGATVLAETTPVHVGRRTSVWQTRLTLDDDRMVAMVMQTQMVLT